MKIKIFKAVMLTIITVILFGCKKEDTEETGDPEIVEQAPVGTTTGPRASKQIGAAGGTVSSTSGALSVTIPSGALSENTTISIEPITSTNPAGVGQSFRLLPHGTKFLKPVEITFSYASVKNKIPLVEALTVSYQDDNGVWRVSGETQINRSAETITVKADHFSDWVPMKWLDLVPGTADLESGKKLTLKAIRYIKVEDDDFLVVPLVPGKVKDAPVIKAMPLENKHILKWALGGPGELNSRGNTAVLTAPKSIINGSGAAVSLEVKSPGTVKRLLVANITYVSEEFLMVRFNDGEWKTYFGSLSNLQDGSFGIAGMEDRTTLSTPLVITWKNGAGTHNWTDTNEERYAHFGYINADGTHFDHLYETINDPYHPSEGNLHIPEINKDGYSTGTFILNSAGKWSSSGKFIGKAKIEGKFRLKYFKP